MGEPKQTLYIRGLPDKVSAEEMRRALYLYCTQFGPVLEVSYRKSSDVYGQAFVVFTDVATATSARRELNERRFYGRVVQAFYAKRQSFSADPGERRRRDLRRERESGVKRLREG
ncbi:U2 small nuclear ribonucleoprotein B [Trypanosoma conorhini]|uniref:U2 small nuclear ribonucleoprotein B n=1 Tax=Trypanosoma conorhini TaxID=83891 RepID=A0A3R7PM55_9TRYP|nr:U2 small nuclear ribonucleoprotein B [Trypanosoma conorhini]RNF22022.1 U2 small nuclear ribonucleoprotein B [Trypanosoma conorhini]